MAGYMDEMQDALRGSGLPRALGIDKSEIKSWGSGMDFSGLMQVLPEKWIVHCDAARSIGLEGVTTHFEMERPGYLVLHCEPYPRIGKKAEQDQRVIKPILDLKARITEILRDKFTRTEPGPFPHDAKRCRDALDPSSNKVVGFDLRLPELHKATDAAPIVAAIIERFAPIVEEVIVEAQAGNPSVRTPTPWFTERVAASSPIPPIENIEPILSTIRRIRDERLPERNMEDAVKDFLLCLGWPRHLIAFQIGRMDIRVAKGVGDIWMVIEVKRDIRHANILVPARSQARGYAEKNGAPVFVVTDSNRYELYDRRRAGDIPNMHVGSFELLQWRDENEELLRWLKMCE